MRRFPPFLPQVDPFLFLLLSACLGLLATLVDLVVEVDLVEEALDLRIEALEECEHLYCLVEKVVLEGFQRNTVNKNTTSSPHTCPHTSKGRLDET